MTRNTTKQNKNKFIYGTHSVKAALENKQRKKYNLYITQKATNRIKQKIDKNINVIIADTKKLEKLTNKDAVHQGIVLECDELEFLDASETFVFAQDKLIVALDQITDPHNVGAIMRSATALGIEGMILPHRNSAPQSGVLAKAASGALDMMKIMETRKLAKTLTDMEKIGFEIVGLDSEAEMNLEQIVKDNEKPIVLVLGAEGKGMRENTRENCTKLAKLEMKGPIKSLNVSNAATLAIALIKNND